MLTTIFTCTEILLYFITAMVISRYIFLIPPLPRCQSVFLTGAIAGGMGLCYYFGRLPAFLFLLCAMGVYTFLTGQKRKRRIFRVLLVFPILGICFGLLMPLVKLPLLMLRPGSVPATRYALVIYGATALVLLLFCILGHRWRVNFREEMRYRFLERWEQIFLYLIGILMLGVAAVLYSYDDIEDGDYELLATFSILVLSVVGFTVTVTIIVLILQGNKKAHMQADLLQMQHNIIITMADIVENRDENTGGHIKRTAQYVEIIGQALRSRGCYRSILTPQYLADTVAAAPLHDIGKIHVPDAVLKKQGSLTEEEFAVMKGHTTAGRVLLQRARATLGDFSYLETAVQMAGSHHERWDGTGYPDGLSGQDIPLCARIMAVADVFDALVSQRCYKGAMTFEEAFSIIRRESGTHFDPIGVDAFLSARREIEQVTEEMREDAAVPAAPGTTDSMT